MESQAKRSHPTGRWTLATFAGADIQLVRALGSLLDGNGDRFAFVSSSEARELAELSDRARQAATSEEFETAFLATREHAERFARLCNAWNGCDLPTAYDRLRRIEERSADEHTIEQLSRWAIAAIFLGNANDLLEELSAWIAESEQGNGPQVHPWGLLTPACTVTMVKAVHPVSARNVMKRVPAMMLVLLLVGGAPVALEAQEACPTDLPLPAGTTCYSGVDEHGAYFLIAVPKDYTNQLVLWNHGYDLASPAPLRVADLGPAVLLLPQGYAVAASSYRPDALRFGGWAVADGAEDTERLRLEFTHLVGQPNLTFVIGASEGGLITAAIAERFGTADDGTLNYHGALPLCGPLAGGRRNWYGGFDLRVVYQYYCQNLPRSDEPQYPLFLGLALDNTITPQEEASRVNECTGILLPPDHRTPQQRENLANILNVTHIPESFLLIDMGFATFALQELVQVRTWGRSPVTNLDVTYSGSTDDEALNAGVFRTGSDPDAVAWLVGAYDPTGAVPMPTFTMHTIGDGLVIVENERAYRQTLKAAGNDANLFQMYTNANGHCQFSTSELMASFSGLRGWVDTGLRPTPDEIVGLCEQFREVFGDTCNFNTTFRPKRFESRVPPREP